MIKESTDILELVLKVFAVMGGIAGAFVFIRKEVKAYNEKMTNFFTGKWGNEGVIDGPKQSHYIELEIEAEAGEVKGCFDVRKLEEDHAWHVVSFHGKRFLSKAKCKIIHIRHGQPLDYGTVVLKKKSKHEIVWQLKEGVADFFPKETVLFKRDL